MSESEKGVEMKLVQHVQHTCSQYYGAVRTFEVADVARLYASMAALRSDVIMVTLCLATREVLFDVAEGAEPSKIDEELMQGMVRNCEEHPLVRGALDAQASAERRMYGWKVRAEHAEGTVERVWRALGSLSRGKL